jgi:hypothetical protein
MRIAPIGGQYAAFNKTKDQKLFIAKVTGPSKGGKDGRAKATIANLR